MWWGSWASRLSGFGRCAAAGDVLVAAQGVVVADLPTGTVTFLFTDLESSTRLWEQHPEAMKAALALHDELLRVAVESHGGVVVKTTGDGVHAAFGSAEAALRAAARAQVALGGERWGVTGPLRVRMGLHTGAAEFRHGDYFGPALNRAARLMQAGHGGQVLVSLATEELVRDSLDAEVGLVELGEHRLRDLSRPERVFQLTGPGLESRFGPLRTLESFPGNLPLQLTSFVGRRAELAEILADLNEARVVTLTGVGGVGKTRLALQVAAEALPRFGDGAWLIELGPIGEPEAVVDVAAATLGVQQHQGRSLAESIVEALRTRQLLVVLDNCEHLLAAASALVDALVRGCAGVWVLATSREALEMPGERSRRVPSLPLPARASTVEEVGGSEAARLFVERAQEVRRGFVLDASTAGSVAQICRRLDGIPLAIELAAARVASMQPADIGARLDERFRLLTGGRRTAVERHQTLRATVDWSYELLDDVERLVFARLGVFAGGFTLEAAEEVVADEVVAASMVVDVLDALVARSMVALDETSLATRYELLETMRQYALEHIEASGDADVLRARHAANFVAFSRRAGAGLLGPDEETWAVRVEADLENLRAAFTWAIDDGNVDLAVGIPAPLWYRAFNTPQWGIGRWGEEAAAMSGLDEHPDARTVLAVAISSHAMVGDLAEAQRCFDRVVDLERQHGLSPDAASRTAMLSVAPMDARLEETIRLNQEAMEAAAEAGDESVCNLAQATLSIFRWIAGDRDVANQLANDALQSARQSQSPTRTALALYGRAYTLQDDDPDRAISHLREGIDLFRRTRTNTMTMLCLQLLSRLEAQHGDTTAALQSALAALRHGHETRNRLYTSYGIRFSASVLLRVNRNDAAAVLWGWIDDAGYGLLTGGEAMLSEHDTARIREALGAKHYAALRAKGAAMTYDEIIKYTLEETEQSMFSLKTA
jgi:predicted ATPase/class 3 adenylate cyclase